MKNKLKLNMNISFKTQIWKPGWTRPGNEKPGNEKLNSRFTLKSPEMKIKQFVFDISWPSRCFYLNFLKLVKNDECFQIHTKHALL